MDYDIDKSFEFNNYKSQVCKTDIKMTFWLRIYSKKRKWARMFVVAQLGVSCECRGLSMHIMIPENDIWTVFLVY